jgi:hypothetical protein
MAFIFLLTAGAAWGLFFGGIALLLLALSLLFAVLGVRRFLLSAELLTQAAAAETMRALDQKRDLILAGDGNRETLAYLEKVIRIGLDEETLDYASILLDAYHGDEEALDYLDEINDADQLEPPADLT